MKTTNRDTLEDLYQKEVNFIDDCKYRIKEKVYNSVNHRLIVGRNEFSVVEDIVYMNNFPLFDNCDFENIAFWADFLGC